MIKATKEQNCKRDLGEENRNSNALKSKKKLHRCIADGWTVSFYAVQWHSRQRTRSISTRDRYMQPQAPVCGACWHVQPHQNSHFNAVGGAY